ncbi:MAG: hypothetical protein Q8S33_36165 [Myxococcales bacterium]|nr:hypothetical protein [Myxococcales bacterium]
MSRLTIAALVAGFVIGLGCRTVDPDKGTFSCATTDDCGAGYECRLQFAGGGRCFVVGFCKDEEVCNGIDDTCDGRVDETFPSRDAACTSGQLGVCAPGKTICLLGTEVCEAQARPTVEQCNQLDDDCDGQRDEDFDLMTDVANCGACGVTCTSGTLCRSGACVESRCDDAADNDSNGKTDCDDEACFGFDCNTMRAPSSRCGFAPVIPDAGVRDGGAADAGGVDAGAIDAGNSDAGSSDAGAVDGGNADAGPIDGGFVRGCFRPEGECADGFDNDGDGLADCADPDCNNQRCFTGQVCTMGTCPGPG